MNKQVNQDLKNLRNWLNANKFCLLHNAYYSSLVWAQNSNSIEKTICFAKKSLRIIYFLNHNPHASPLFRELNILKLPDKNALENRLFIIVSTNVYPQSLKIGLLSRLVFIPTILVGPI